MKSGEQAARAALRPGLVSITFRSLPVATIVEMTAAAGLELIEWGGDVHVPPGAVEAARETAQRTRDGGLEVAAYGSYYRLGGVPEKGSEFERVLESAVALGAPTIRVWAGGRGSAEISAAERTAVVADALRVAALAQKAGIGISLEYHGGTLTDSRESVQRLLVELPHPNIAFLWQPANGVAVEENLERLADVMPRLGHVHAFHWWPTPFERRPLADGGDRWQRYIEAIRAAGKAPAFLLEFVANDSIEQFQADAATLRRWLSA